MSKQALMKELESLGTAQNRKIYGRHGITSPMFGVSWAAIGKIVKRIKQDQTLAEALWKTGNHDARVVATMIADPHAFNAKMLDLWAKDIGDYAIGDAFAALASRSPKGWSRAMKWIASPKEWISATGWTVVSRFAALEDTVEPDDRELEALLATIAKDIHGAKNRTRHAMNQAVIGIGVRNAALQKKAEATARKIGKVEVDHGETSCKTPDALPYIRKTVAHRKAMAARRKAKAATKKKSVKKSAKKKATKKKGASR